VNAKVIRTANELHPEARNVNESLSEKAIMAAKEQS
jgi:hypothetical protein